MVRLLNHQQQHQSRRRRVSQCCADTVSEYGHHRCAGNLGGEATLISSQHSQDIIMASPILWQNTDHTVTLIDIARSIESAQGTLQQQCNDHLLSVQPLEAPFPSNEPKSEGARAKLASNSVDQKLHRGYAYALNDALKQVREHYEGDWCLARPSVQERPRVMKKRKLDHACILTDQTLGNRTDSPVPGIVSELPEDVLQCLARPGETADHSYHLRLHRDQTPSIDPSEAFDDNRYVANTGTTQTTLEVEQAATGSAYHFRIPPRSSFYLGDCSDARSFRTAVRHQAYETETRKNFDFILLDPPWPNRSVKRTHRTAGSTYATVATLDDLRNLLLGMDLDMLMAEDCLVGMWITNRPALRELVLGEGGVFDCWGVELTEEWVWLKTTIHGEPVTRLDALWRKPYEMLLLGRRRRASVPTPTGGEEVKRRVLISVPDLHSRKPCLKELIEPMMPDRNDYKALEVFARYLVAGWCSWGDECIKFNWEGYWKLGEDVADSANSIELLPM